MLKVTLIVVKDGVLMISHVIGNYILQNDVPSSIQSGTLGEFFCCEVQ